MKKLFILAVSIMATVAVSAQVSLQNKKHNPIYVMPAEFTSDGKDYLQSFDDGIDASRYEDGHFYSDAAVSSYTLDVFNDDFEKVKSVNIPVDVYNEKTTVYNQEMVPTVASTHESEVSAYIPIVDSDWTIIEAIYSPQFGEGKAETKGDTTYIYPTDTLDYYDYEKYGELYPREYYKYSRDWHLFRVSIVYQLVATENWVVDEDNGHEYNEGFCASHIEAGQYGEDFDFIVTQTLFNNDANYEYLKPVCELITETDADTITEYDYEGGLYYTYIKKSVHNNYYIKGFNIVSETGTVLATASFDYFNDTPEKGSWVYFNLIKLNDKTYLCANTTQYTYYYKIDPTSSSIKQVGRAKKAHVSPTVANRYEDITVELEEDGTSAHKVSVVDAAGRTVYNANVPAGQRSVKINASRLSNGMNIISVKNGNSKPNNCKVYVK